MAEFNGKLWVLGGAGGASATYALGDVWSSADGINWTLATSSPGWSARSGHATVVFANRMWVLGGNDGAANAEVWSSADGVNWNGATRILTSGPMNRF